MNKNSEHLVDLISNSLVHQSGYPESNKYAVEFKNYLNKLNLDQLRTMSKEFIL